MEITLKEYGHKVVVSKKMLHYTMGYICPDKDTCEICNWVPTPLTNKQKHRIFWRKVRWNLGKPFGAIAYKLGYVNHNCEDREDY